MRPRHLSALTGIALISGILLTVGVLYDRPDRVGQPTETVSKTIRFSYTLHNSSNRVVPVAEFWVYGPVKQSATQVCEHIQSSHPYDLFLDGFGNQVLHFWFENLPPFASKIIDIQATLTLNVNDYRTSQRPPPEFVNPAPFIESNHPDIVSTAIKLKKTGAIETAKHIHHWVSDHMQPDGYLPNSRGALYALKHRNGDCSESMYLFTALCRAVDIPARGVGGYVVPQSRVVKSRDYHNWAEFYDGGTWWIADPYNRRFEAGSADYIAMHFIHASTAGRIPEFRRFHVEGPGVTVVMN